MLEVFNALLHRLCPESCPRCRVASDLGFCGDCRQQFRRVPSPCPRCGMPAPCAPCPMTGPGWFIDSVRAPFAYGPPLTRYLWALKFQGQRLLGRALGQLLVTEIESPGIDIDAILSVPLHPRRLRSRGFNQADEIAGPIAARLKRPALVSGVRRKIETRPQTELDRHARLKNPHLSFSITRDFTGYRLAIVDDVITTGATVNALAEALKGNGAVSVVAWAVARGIGGAQQTG